MRGLLDALLNSDSGGGLLGGLPAWWQYATSAPDAAAEKNAQYAAYGAAMAQNSHEGFANPNATPIYQAAPGANIWSNGAPGLIGVQPGQYGGSTLFGRGGIHLPAPVAPPGAPASGPFPAVPYQNLTARALRMNGVPEADIPAAIKKPELMKALINQIYHPASAGIQSTSPSAAVATIGDDRMSTIAALRGIPLAGAYVDKGTALLNAAASMPLAGQRSGPINAMNIGGYQMPQSAARPADAQRALRPPAPTQPATLGTAGQTRGALSDAPQNSPDQNAAKPTVQLAQYAPAIPGLPLPMPGGIFRPGTPENDQWTRDFIDSNRRAGHAIEGILHNENAQRPPAGSRPIDQTPWSGDHGEIKKAIDAGGKDRVSISPTGEVWSQNPDGSWTNHGPAGNFTGSGRPSGLRGKDRDRW